jgi:hypothetical protein
MELQLRRYHQNSSRYPQQEQQHQPLRMDNLDQSLERVV